MQIYSKVPYAQNTRIRVKQGKAKAQIYRVRSCVDLKWISGGEWAGYNVVLVLE